MIRKVLVLVLAAATMGAFLVSSGSPASGQSLTDQPFAAYGTGSVISVNALQLGSTQVAGLHAAVSGGSVNSRDGLGGAITSELGQNVQPSLPDKNAYGRGAGLEVGAATPLPQNVDLNQIKLAQLAEAAAPPVSPLVTREIPLALNPVLYSSTLRGQAKATFDPNYCPIGRELSYGLGSAENLQIISTSTANEDGSFAAPLLGTSISTEVPRAVSQSRTFTYMTSNGDGTFGLVSETRQTVAPITVGGNPLIGGLVTIEVAGEFVLRAIATGKPGGAKVEYSGNPVITVKLGAVQLLKITLQDVLGSNGLALPVPPVLNATIGTPPHAIKNAAAPKVEAPDGTTASAGVDAIRLQLLPIPGLTAADVAIGHMEASATVPAGGLKCRIPVSKTVEPDPVQAGNIATYRIQIPSDVAQFAALFDCDLVNISAVDNHSVHSGNPRFQILSADNGGVVSGNRVTWANLGNYSPGGQPIVLSLQVRILGGSGVLRDVVDVSATLGNCKGGAVGTNLVGQARLDGSAITGTITLVGPTVGRGALPATGGNTVPLVAGGAMALLALAMMRLRRRVTAP